MSITIILLTFASLLCIKAYEVPYPETDLEICVRSCHQTEQELSGLLTCTSRCKQIHESSSRRDDPKSPRWEIERCQERCGREERCRREVRRCQQRCEEGVIKRREEEQQRGEERQHCEHEREREGRRNQQDPQWMYEKCLEVCRKQPPRQEWQCKKRCKRQLEEEGSGKGKRDPLTESRGHGDNPYHFRSDARMESRFKSQEGHFKVLERFSDRFDLLRGIENYRLAVFEANPSTFLVPHHSDAEVVFVVLNGKGILSYVLGEKRVSHSLERGDVIWVPAGAHRYWINPDSRQKLRVALLNNPVNAPGNFQEYFSVGGRNPESFYSVFSNDILEAAFNTQRHQLDRLLGQQKQGAILKVPSEKLKALSKHSPSTKERGRSIRDPLNLLELKPIYSNNHGKFHEASPNDHKQLQNMDVSVSLANITQGSLMVPHYNSKQTTIVLVVEGSGRIEMACPHLASQGHDRQEPSRRQGGEQEEETETSGEYMKIRSHLSTGDVFIIPASHPVAVVASHNENLVGVGFGINAKDNERNFLAGRENIISKIDREAREMSFNVPAEMIEEILTNQKESYFVSGRGSGRGREEEILASILNFPGLF